MKCTYPQALAALAADPVASLVGTAFVSRLGSAPVAGGTSAEALYNSEVQHGSQPDSWAVCAAVGTALSIFGALTKLLNVPLLSVTTSRVASAVGASTGTRPVQSQMEFQS